MTVHTLPLFASGRNGARWRGLVVPAHRLEPTLIGDDLPAGTLASMDCARSE
jgi:hypothetical protein